MTLGIKKKLGLRQGLEKLDPNNLGNGGVDILTFLFNGTSATTASPIGDPAGTVSQRRGARRSSFSLRPSTTSTGAAIGDLVGTIG